MTGRPLTARDVDLLGVARRHGTVVAADWGGVDRMAVVRLRRRADGYSRGRGAPKVAELAAWAEHPDCWCPRCAGPAERAVADGRLLEFAALGYGPPAIAKMMGGGSTVEQVRGRLRELRPVGSAGWRSL